MNNRRRLVIALGVATCSLARAQQPKKNYRIGYLAGAPGMDARDRGVCRQDTIRCKARESPRAAADEIPPGDQSENGQGARHHGSADGFSARGQSDPVTGANVRMEKPQGPVRVGLRPSVAGR